MTSASRALAVWLTPAVVLALPAALAARGPDGLWLGLVLAFTPLMTLGLASTYPETTSSGSRGGGGEPLFPVVTLLITVGVLLWANIVLAGDAAAWLGARRWQGIVVVAVTGWLLTTWRPLRRTAPALLAVALVAAIVPLAQLGWTTGLGPLAAWDRVATQPAFRFPPSSRWVTAGRDLAAARGGKPLVFEEVHRLTAPAGGLLRARTLDGSRLAEIEWSLTPGQTVTLRAGDELVRGSAVRLRFESDKRVPGAPSSGMTWAEDRPRRWLDRVGLLVTLVAGAAALLRAGLTVRLSRRGFAVVAGGLLITLVWAQGWAIYSTLQAPDLFLGGVTLERLLELPGPALFAGPVRRALQALLLVAGLAAFLASTVALRERLGAMDRTGGGEIGHDPGLWAGLFGGAALASLWPVDPWALTLLALGGAGCALGPAALCSPPPGRTIATTAGVVGLIVFATVAAAQLRGAGGGLLGAVIGYPALAGAPAGALVLWLGRR
ncbi:MAG TPA: hypothetical protein VN323_16785 [Candidatus Dormibacteraeota bacterium]|nr:hypothetical protein [Candidatus Dormibacteraeota bacterium]